MGVLDGKSAIVTGSARGIGRATAELLAEQGAQVLINDLDGDVAEVGRDNGHDARLAGEVPQHGVQRPLARSTAPAAARGRRVQERRHDRRACLEHSGDYGATAR